MAAADGFRLSVRKAELPQSVTQPINVIIPARALNELARVASDGEEPLYMVVPKNRGQVLFRVKDVEVVSQLIEGTFPDYHQIIPRNYKSRTLVSTASLLKACKQAEIFAREGSNVARFDIKQASGWGRCLDRVQCEIFTRGAGSYQDPECCTGNFCRKCARRGQAGGRR